MDPWIKTFDKTIQALVAAIVHKIAQTLTRTVIILKPDPSSQ